MVFSETLALVAEDKTGARLGVVVTGGSVKKSRQLIPFIREEVVKAVDLDEGFIVVDWEQEQSGADED